MRAALLVILACLACDTGVEPGEPALSPSCNEATEHSDLEWIQDEIFTPSCASFSACHRGAARSAQGLNLEEGQALTNLVGIDSILQPGTLRVDPASPDDSLLLLLLGGIDGPSGPVISELGTMPPQSELLCEPKRAAVRRWIESLPATTAR